MNAWPYAPSESFWIVGQLLVPQPRKNETYRIYAGCFSDTGNQTSLQNACLRQEPWLSVQQLANARALHPLQGPAYLTSLLLVVSF